MLCLLNYPWGKTKVPPCPCSSLTGHLVFQLQLQEKRTLRRGFMMALFMTESGSSLKAWSAFPLKSSHFTFFLVHL